MIINFISIVEFLLILRLLIIFYGAIRIIYILYDKSHIEFLKKYRSFIDLKKISTFFISIFSLICFEYLVFSLDAPSLESVFESHLILSVIIFISLISVLIYSFNDTRKNIQESHLVKEKIKTAIRVESIASGLENITSTSNNLFAKIVNVGSKVTKKVIENKIETEIKDKTHSVMFSVLIMVSINLMIIIASYYVII